VGGGGGVRLLGRLGLSLGGGWMGGDEESGENGDGKMTGY
jgi:hypothetical protein